MNRIIKPLVVVLAAIWFLADAIFSTIAHPLARWLGEHWVLFRLRAWIRSLRPYPALALFAVPLVILEPVKPVAAYLAATGPSGHAPFRLRKMLLQKWFHSRRLI